MDLKTFQTTLSTHTQSTLANHLEQYQTLGVPAPLLLYLKHLAVLASGGKNIRPYLTWSILKHYAPEENFKEHEQLLVAIELFHLFCLIHDDVMDESLLRHGVNTMHAEAALALYPTIPSPARDMLAKNQAILAGDMLLNVVFKIFYEYAGNGDSPLDSKLRHCFHTLVDEVCLGQMIDIDLTTKREPKTETIFLKNILKTARYSFVHPLSLGALVAGNGDKLQFLAVFGEKLGLLYQIQDDIFDVMGDFEQLKKPLFQDVAQMQPTILTQHIHTRGGEHQRQLISLLGNTVAAEDYALVQKLFVDSGAVAHAEALSLVLEKELSELSTTFTLNEKDQEFFQNICSLIINRTA